MKLIINAVAPSLNRLLRLHWRKKQALNAMWIMLVRSEFVPKSLTGPYPNGAAKTKMRVKITLCHSRLFDRDNAYGSVKPLVDALTHWKIIKDDSAEWLDLVVGQSLCPHKKRHTIIEVEPA
jgi:hypothetical protein